MRYKDLLAEMLDKIRQERGEEEMRRQFKKLKPFGMEAMNREVIVQFLATKDFTQGEREKYFAKYPELRAVYDSRLQ